MEIKKSRYIGQEGTAFERVSLAFRAYGYIPPQPDVEGSEGAYVGNIITEYQGELSEVEVLALIEYGLTNTRASLEQEVLHPDYLMYTLEELADIYLETYQGEHV